MVIDKDIKTKFEQYFNLNFEKYRDDDYSELSHKDKIDSMKMYDYMIRKYKFNTSLIECIEIEYGKECKLWYEKTFLK